MRIDSLDAYYVAMPLIYPWRTAYGEDREIHSVLIRLSGGGESAWTESTCFFAPTYANESAGSVFHLVTEVFGPHILGREYDSATELDARLSVFKGNSFAKAAIESGWWTLQSRLTGDPLYRLLGGSDREVVAGADFGIQDSLDMLLGNIQTAVDQGFPRIKLKVARGWDLEVLQAVHAAFPGVLFHIDCNAGYTLDDLPLFRQLDRLGLAFIEQPLAYGDLNDHAQLARQLETPVCLDESITGVASARQAIALKACTYINIKPGRVGGLSSAVAIHDLAADAGIPVWIGGMLESGVGASLCVHLATLPNFTYPGDLFPADRFYTDDLSDTPLVFSSPCHFRPGAALPEPRPQRLEECTMHHRHLEAP